MDPQAIAADVSTYLHRIHTTHWVQVLTTTIIIYDILTTFDREYHYVWRTRWSYAKVIFFLNRYLAPISFLCIKTGWFFGLTCALVMTIVSSVLVTRLWAVYERDRRVLAVLISAFLIIFIPSWIICFRGFSVNSQQRDTDTLIHNYAYLGMARAMGQKEVDKVWILTRCFLPHFPKQYPAVIVASLLFESGVFTAMAYKMIKDKKKTRLIEAFYRDGVIYYIVMFCALLSGAICAFAYDNTTAQAIMGSAYFIGIKSMMCSHIILRLRSYFGHGDSVVDGREDDPFAPEGGEKMGNIDSTEGMISTIINFARLEALGGHISTHEPEAFSGSNRQHHRRPRDQEAAIPLDTVETLQHDAAGAKLQKWGTEEEKLDSSTSGGVQSFMVPSTSDSEPSVDWTDLPAPRPRRSSPEDARHRRRTFEVNPGSTGVDRSLKPPEAGGQLRERPKSMDGRTTGVAEQGSPMPSGRMSLQGSSTTRLEMDELTLAGSREPRRPSSKLAV
ncbi:hypothetical protein FS837_000780 [Tulasnella sp. UAMH 9824]|nr:hypothetical protein FS837_000780 [Tulasnella sp. UAMH 9824]